MPHWLKWFFTPKSSIYKFAQITATNTYAKSHVFKKIEIISGKDPEPLFELIWKHYQKLYKASGIQFPFSGTQGRKAALDMLNDGIPALAGYLEGLAVASVFGLSTVTSTILPPFASNYLLSGIGTHLTPLNSWMLFFQKYGIQSAAVLRGRPTTTHRNINILLRSIGFGSPKSAAYTIATTTLLLGRYFLTADGQQSTLPSQETDDTSPVELLDDEKPETEPKEKTKTLPLQIWHKAEPSSLRLVMERTLRVHCLQCHTLSIFPMSFLPYIVIVRVSPPLALFYCRHCEDFSIGWWSVGSKVAYLRTYSLEDYA